VSQFRNTIPLPPVPLFSSPGMATPQQAHLYHATPTQSPAITRYATPRVCPGQAPYPRVTPRVIPRHVSPPRVDPIVALIPQPAAPNAPYFMCPKVWQVKTSSTLLRRNTWKVRPHRGTTLGPGPNTTLQTSPNRMHHAFYARSLLSLAVMLLLKRPITK
jgi:hypothetical protein